ncbi:RUN domain-containing protein 1-like isoform X2 [Tigriopus californicus]|nr:RUN domain-containing protein 1-like isoform X2 [Tigriopus californicus]
MSHALTPPSPPSFATPTYQSEDDYDDLFSDEDSAPPKGKRLAPVGQAANEDEMSGQICGMLKNNENPHFRHDFADFSKANGSDGCSQELKRRIEEMEEEQEELNNSLMSMTSHFAKVQLRLQQVVGAPSDKREILLKELEHFAFRGIPSLSTPQPTSNFIRKSQNNLEENRAGKSGVQPEDEKQLPMVESMNVNNDILEAQRIKHTKLINQLKTQLEDLESYAFESGEAIVPSNLLLNRQRIVMDQLKSRLNLNMDNIVKFTEDELKAQVDSAVGEIVNPLKMKSHLVTQLMTQITDLEMFIQFLQSETSTMLPVDCQDCGCSKHNSPSHGPSNTAAELDARHRARIAKFRSRTKSEQEEIRQQTVSILQKAMAVLQLTTISQFGCGAEQFSKNTLKRTTKGKHYGDLRARLELAVDHMLDACSTVECLTDTDCSTSMASEAEAQPEYLMASPQVTSIARKELAPAIRDLIQHGLIQTSSSSSIVPFMTCMSNRSSAKNRSILHAWDIILHFYRMKQGPEFNSAPQRKLSASFGLDLAGSATSNKQSLLSTIGNILNTHGQYKRSPDAHFKAFICEGLNKRKLIPWFKLLFRNQSILETYYQNWSYVAKTGFDDALRLIERLSIYVFDIPVDVAVRHFKDMSEAF